MTGPAVTGRALTDEARLSPWLPCLVAVGAMVAAAAHLPVTPEHLAEAPYMGVLFLAFSLGALAAAAAVLLDGNPLRYGLLGGTCLAAVGAYAATRLVAFPQLADDVGSWLEPLGVVSVLSEALTAALCLLGARPARPARPGAAAGVGDDDTMTAQGRGR